MILFHGSNMRVSEIELAKSRPGKDFGRAFYLSESEVQATEMAQFKAATFGGDVVINKFYFDEKRITEAGLKFLQFGSYTEEWARFVLDNRQSLLDRPAHDNDIVFGPIANDRIGRQIFNFTAGYIDFDTFLRRIQFPEGVTFQWAFCTEKAIRLLKHIDQ